MDSTNNINRQLFAVFSLTLVNSLGFTILIPVLPFMLRAWNTVDWLYGVILATYSLAQFWAAPIFGTLSDKYGRKRLLLVSQFGTLLAWLLLALIWFIDEFDVSHASLPLVLLVVSRVLDGVTGGNTSVANAYLSDIVPAEQKVKYFGYIGAIMGAGMIIGPAIGAYTMASSISYLATAIFSIVLSVITLLFIYFFVPNSNQALNPNARIEWLKPFRVINAIAEYKDRIVVRNVLITRLGFSATMAAYTSVMVFFLMDGFELTKIEVGNFLIFVGVASIVNQLLLVKRIIDILGDPLTLAAGIVLLGAGLFTFPLITNFTLFVAVYYFVNLGFSITIPVIKSTLSNQSSEQEQGKIMGLDESFSALTMGIMPILATYLYGVIGSDSFFVWSAIAMSTLIFLILACSSLSNMFRKNKSITSQK